MQNLLSMWWTFFWSICIFLWGLCTGFFSFRWLRTTTVSQCERAAGWESVSRAVLDIALHLPASRSLSCVAVATTSTYRHPVVVAYPYLRASSFCFCALLFPACYGTSGSCEPKLETNSFLRWQLPYLRLDVQDYFWPTVCCSACTAFN